MAGIQSIGVTFIMRTPASAGLTIVMPERSYRASRVSILKCLLDPGREHPRYPHSRILRTGRAPEFIARRVPRGRAPG